MSEDHMTSRDLSQTDGGVRAAGEEPDARSWWWGRDQERFYGPCHSRADAIMEAWSDDPDLGAFIMRAEAGKWRIPEIEGDYLQELFDDANDELADPDGDPPSTCIPATDWKRAAKTITNVLRAMVRRSGSLSWAFTNQSECEWVNIPAMWRAADAAKDPTRD